MKIINSRIDSDHNLLFSPAHRPEPCGLCLGFFDGVHRGHMELLRSLVSVCLEEQLSPQVFTFETLPKVRRSATTGLLQSRKACMAFLEEVGVETVYLQAFTEDFARLTGEAFFEEVLVRGLGARFLVVGYDFRFGNKMGWGIPELQALCDAAGVKLLVVPPVHMGGEAVHSKRIRRALAEGKMEEVVAQLGHPYRLVGTVVAGRQLGRSLDFPTANVYPEASLLLPPLGVYASKTRVDGQLYDSLSSLGRRPTVEAEGEICLETYLYPFRGDLYGKTIEVQLESFLRPEERFPSVEALKTQMVADLEEAKRRLAKHSLLEPRATIGRVPIYVQPEENFHARYAIVGFHLPMDEEAAKRSLLVNYLTELSAEAPSLSGFQRLLKKKYGASLNLSITKMGDVHNLLVGVRALDRGPDASYPFAETLRSVLRCFTRPHWDPEVWEMSRQNLLDEVEAEFQDKASLAWLRTLELSYPDSPLSQINYGSREALAKVTMEEAQAYLPRLLEEAEIRISVAASFAQGENEAWFQALREELAVFPSPKGACFRLLPGRCPRYFSLNRVVDVRETKRDLAQSRLEMLFDTGIHHASDRSAVLALLHEMLGGDSHSLLFEEVREKRGLAYSIYSSTDALRGYLSVSAGIHPGHEEEAKQAILEAVAAIGRGDYDERLLTISRTALRKGLLLQRERPYSALWTQLRRAVLGLASRPEEELLLLEDVSREEVEALARRLCLKTTYVLQPERTEEVQG